MKKNILFLIMSGLLLSYNLSAFVQADYDKAFALSYKLSAGQTPTDDEKDLSNRDLSSADLSGFNLSGAILSYAKLSGADLSGANLSGANLSGAQLYKTDFKDALNMTPFMKGYARNVGAINVPN